MYGGRLLRDVAFKWSCHTVDYDPGKSNQTPVTEPIWKKTLQ